MLQLTQTPSGYDLAVNDGSDEAMVATLVYAALFTDAEAPSARVPDTFLRRGWWAVPAAGSGVWHVRMQPLSVAARREAIATVRAALQAHGLDALTVSDITPAGNVSGVVVAITGRHNGLQITMSLPL